MIKAPDISIVILNYNSIFFLEKCLKSVKESKLNGLSIEIIVIDNASSDGSAKKIRKSHPEVTLIESGKNIGFAAGNNLAKKLVKGQYLLFLNPDTVLEKDTLFKTFQFMEENSKVGAATCRLQLPNGKLDYSTHRGFPTPTNALFYFFIPLAKVFPKSKAFSGYTLGWKLSDSEPHEVDAISGAFFFVRAEAAKKVGWWDEDYFWYGEDLEFCYQLKKEGWKIMFITGASAIHYKGVSSGIKKHSQEFSSASEETKRRSVVASIEVMRIFYKKHYLNKYPKIVSFIVLTGIKLLERVRLLSIKK